MCPRRPSCPPADRPESNAAHTAAFPPRQGPRLAQFRCGRWSAPFRRITTSNTATGLAGDHLVAIHVGHRAAFMHAAQLWQAEHVAWAAWCAVAVVTTTRGRWCHLAWLYPAATALVVLASANHFLLDAAGGLAVAGLGMLAASRPSQLLTRRPTGRLHGRTEAQRRETQMSVTTFLQRATDSVTFAGGGKRGAFPQCREGADHD